MVFPTREKKLRHKFCYAELYACNLYCAAIFDLPSGHKHHLLRMKKKQIINLKKWYQWFAGFIDGDGSILVYKDHVSIEATTSFDDSGILSDIKKKFGGSIKIRSNAQALRWRSRKKAVVINVIEQLNGLLYNSIRLGQFQNACAFLNFVCIPPVLRGYRRNEQFTNSAMQSKDCIFNNAYLSGLFDADGTISLNVHKKKILNKDLNNLTGNYGKIQRLIYSRGFHQCQIKCTNKYKNNVEIFNLLRIGSFIQESNAQKLLRGQEKWHWILKQDEIPVFLEYLKKNPLKGKKKKHRFHLLPTYFKLKTLKAHLAPENSIEFKAWQNFCNQWYKF